jgi:tetratricopeptide (TPR) repeat protein
MSLLKRPTVSRLALAVLAPWCIANAALAAPSGDFAEVQRLLKAGQPAEALRRIEQQSAANATDVQWRFVKAVALSDLARPAEAIKIYTRIIEERPELPEPRNNLAVLYAQQGQFDKARVTFESALRTNQVYAAAYDNLGDVHARLATASYARALQVGDAASAALPALALVRELGVAPAAPVLVAQASPPKPAPAATQSSAPAAPPASAPAVAPAPRA